MAADLLKNEKRKADQLHTEAQALSEEGRDDEAIERYLLAIDIDPEKSESYYNIGLIYKYRNEWRKSFDFNKRALDLDPGDEATCWNLGIAATALRDWTTAREAWEAQGLPIEEGDGPVTWKGGLTPVRLNPDRENAEVVWARRIDPVRAKIESIPLPLSGYRCGDLVLHDGAASGYRESGGHEYPVFNVLELFEASELSTFSVVVEAKAPAEIDELARLMRSRDIEFEDWTANLRLLCKDCSEGRPHDEDPRGRRGSGHQHSLKPKSKGEHRIALAASSQQRVLEILREWAESSSRQVRDLVCELPASVS